jgi:Icc-related predicted phosphoesterase
VKLVLISDTHCQHDKVQIEKCDVLVHAGDLSYRGTEDEITPALVWLQKQPAEFVVLIAGNHDWLFERNPVLARTLLSQYPKIKYLEDESVTLHGVKFWGSPYTPEFCNWAFNANQAEIKPHWDAIPDDTDVLVTHGPAYGLLDRAHPTGPKLGCQDLAKAVTRVGPMVHVFGHIHGGYGSQNGMVFNASVVNESYIVKNPPHVLEINWKLNTEVALD